MKVVASVSYAVTGETGRCAFTSASAIAEMIGITSSGLETGVVSIVSEFSGTDVTGSNRVIGLVETSEYSWYSSCNLLATSMRTLNVGSLESIFDGVCHLSMLE